MNVDLKPDVKRPGFYILEEYHIPADSPRMRGVLRPHVWRPPTDVLETDEAYLVRVEIAGMEENDFTILIDGRYLAIRGVRSDIPERRAYHQMEIRFGEFSSEVELPGPVALEGIEAAYGNGFLQVRLPKARPVAIHVEE